MGRTTATVLFTDLVGSTALRSRVGEEAAEDLRRAHDRLLAHAVDANSGRLVKRLGDGIMATFAGASDAVAAAVAIQQAVDRHNRSAQAVAALEVRVGISAGDVTVEDDDVHGTPVIEAARLCGIAGGGEIFASEMVRWLARSSGRGAFSPIGELKLKGLSEVVPAVRVEWEPVATSAIPMPSLLTDVGRIFVGREADLERLTQLWKEAATGERRVALLAGEPGVGKTRLAAELAGQVHDEGAVVLAGRCDEDLGVPYQPFVEALRHFVDHTPPTELAGQLGRYGGELARLMPELAAVVPGLPAPLCSDPETERYRLFDAVAHWLAQISREMPALLIVDDLQWAAKPTLLLLRHVVRLPEPARLLIVATYRDTDITRGHPLTDFLADLRRGGGRARLPLTGLDASGVAAFLAQAAGHTLDDAGTELAAAVWAETEGNPFFVGEVLRHLSESGALERRDGRWVTTSTLESLGIPEGVREVVGRRLSHLSATANRALTTAAVTGIEFDVAVVAAAAAIDDQQLVAALDEAVTARLIVDVPGAHPRNRFSHALVRATLYEELTAARQKVLHGKVAEAIEMVHGGALDDHLPALAHHWARASAPGAASGKAVEYAGRAGDRALAQLAHDEAATYYRQALDLLPSTGAADESRRRLPLLISLGEAQRRSGEPAHRKTLLDAVRLAQQVGDPDALARAALANSRWPVNAWNTVDADKVAALEAALDAIGTGDSPLRARLLATLAVELIFDPNAPDRRVAMSDEALAMARRLKDPATLVPVLVARYVSTMPNAVAERLSDSAELLDAAESVPDPLLRSQAWGMRFRTLLEAGDGEEADRCLHRAAQLVEDLGQPDLRWHLTYIRAARAIVGARFHEAERLAADAQELGLAIGQEGAAVTAAHLFLARLAQGTLDPETEALIAGVTEHRLPIFDIWQVLLSYELGREAHARALLADLRPQDLPNDLFWLSGVCSWAQVAAALGEVTLAEDLRTLLLPYTDHALTLTVLPMPAVVHHLGLIATTVGHYDEAEKRFRAAATIHERLKAPAWLARTRLDWARMLLTRHQPGDTERAGELLGEALVAARELGLGKVERDAAVLLR